MKPSQVKRYGPCTAVCGIKAKALRCTVICRLRVSVSGIDTDIVGGVYGSVYGVACTAPFCSAAYGPFSYRIIYKVIVGTPNDNYHLSCRKAIFS